MIIKNKIGCLDKTAMNYDGTSEIGCSNCCVTQKTDKLLQKIIELVDPNTKPSKQSYSTYAIGYVDSKPLFAYISQAEKYGLQIAASDERPSGRRRVEG